MRVLFAHNQYQHAGGEDSVVSEEIALLRERGHFVDYIGRHNDEIRGMSSSDLFVGTLWSRDSAKRICGKIDEFRPDILHVHNTFPLLSPAIYWAASRRRVPVVQTLHNFRLLCPQAMFLRNGKLCEDCLGGSPWPGVWHACYRNSRSQSAVLALMLSVHRRIGTYRDRVSRYIALNEFCRDKFVQGGLPAEKILIKPNFVKKPSIDCRNTRTSEILFVGRLSHEKGIETLANAAKRQPAIRINVAGTGPLGEMLDGIPNIRRLGFLSPSAILEEMRRALCLVMPSIWYENFPRTLVEAYAMGLPVVASQLGALGELVVDGETGVLFEPGNDEDLAAKLAWAVNNKGEMETRGRAAHRIYEELYSPDANYRILLNIYREAADTS